MKYLNYLILDNILADHFRKKINIIIDNKTVVEGRLILFKHRNYNYQLILSNCKGKRFSYFFPIPFIVNVLSNDNIEMDYTLDSLTGGDTKIINIIKRLKKPNKSEFYNKKANLVFFN